MSLTKTRPETDQTFVVRVCNDARAGDGRRGGSRTAPCKFSLSSRSSRSQSSRVNPLWFDRDW
jgi:hypothetical protein